MHSLCVMVMVACLRATNKHSWVSNTRSFNIFVHIIRTWTLSLYLFFLSFTLLRLPPSCWILQNFCCKRMTRHLSTLVCHRGSIYRQRDRKTEKERISMGTCYRNDLRLLLCNCFFCSVGTELNIFFVFEFLLTHTFTAFVCTLHTFAVAADYATYLVFI